MPDHRQFYIQHYSTGLFVSNHADLIPFRLRDAELPEGMLRLPEHWDKVDRYRRIRATDWHSE